jgi:hypothetical protein
MKDAMGEKFEEAKREGLQVQIKLIENKAGFVVDWHLLGRAVTIAGKQKLIAACGIQGGGSGTFKGEAISSGPFVDDKLKIIWIAISPCLYVGLVTCSGGCRTQVRDCGRVIFRGHDMPPGHSGDALEAQLRSTNQWKGRTNCAFSFSDFSRAFGKARRKRL